ncbi:unnamed protein product [Arabidopsis halleri]
MGVMKKCDCGCGEIRTEKNPGRRFFGCALYKVGGGAEHCKYFKWFEEEELQGWEDNTLIKAVAEIREKEKMIHELQMTIMELRGDLKKQMADAEQVVFRQRLIITGLAGLVVCAVGGFIFA